MHAFEESSLLLLPSKPENLDTPAIIAGTPAVIDALLGEEP
jgi:hypothetical protein